MAYAAQVTVTGHDGVQRMTYLTIAPDETTPAEIKIYAQHIHAGLKITVERLYYCDVKGHVENATLGV